MRADFKDTRPNHIAKGPNRGGGRRGADRPKSKRGASASKAGSAGWPWLLAGILIGLFVAFLWYLNRHAPVLPPASRPAPVAATPPARPAIPAEKPSTVVPRAEPSVPPVPPPTPVKPEPAPPETAAAESPGESVPPAADGPDWRFYELLPKEKVEVPVARIRDARADKPADPAKRMLLQVGSFRNAADADRMKAQLALMGYEAEVVATDSAEHGIWHRVRLGPYDDPRKLARDRAALYTKKIDSLPITLKE